MNSPSNNLKNSELTPQKVCFHGRTLAEYVKMFDLELSERKVRKILDCPSGPASFIAEAYQQGFEVVGCDPLYTDNLEQLIQEGKRGISQTVKILSSYPTSLLSQKFYPSLTALQDCANLALEKFAEDYQIGWQEGRYVRAELPKLPFEDKTFDLVLSGNFLFIYSKLFKENLAEFDYQFHLDSVLELWRVTQKEVKIFPVPCRDGRLDEYAKKLLTDLEKEEIVATIRAVEYEVFKGGNLMLCLSR